MDWDFNWVKLDEPLCLDVETMSGDDNVPALDPYKGHKATMYGLKQKHHAATYCVRSLHNNRDCLPFDAFLKDLRAFAHDGPKWIYGQNIKFDLHFSAQDDVIWTAPKIEDLMVMDRLCNYSAEGRSLEDIAARHDCKLTKEPTEIKQYLARIGSKDYGRIPSDMLARYLLNDLAAEEEVFYALDAKIPKCSAPVRQVEAELTSILFEMERRGIWIDKQWLMERKIDLLMKQIKAIGDIKKASNGLIDNPGSYKQKLRYFEVNKIEPVRYNIDKKTKKRGNASWDGDALEEVKYIPEIRSTVVALLEYSDAAYQDSNFCSPWAAACDAIDHIHTDFRAAGTKTGRLSAADPNVYNPPKWMMRSMRIPKGYVGVKWDKKQIEYRLFTHYTEDPGLIAAYAKDPEMDIHQIVADMMGLMRDPIKSVNFGIIYGQGKDKTTRELASKIIDLDNNPEVKMELKEKCRVAMRGYLKRSLMNQPMEDAKRAVILAAVGAPGTPIPAGIIMMIATQVLLEYHQNIPSIKIFFADVKKTLAGRGWIRNFFGRVYNVPLSKAYVGLNALIQGSAADFFKLKLVELHKACRARWSPDAVIFQDMIYDSCFAMTWPEIAQEYADLSRKIIGDAPFKVPILLDVEVAIYNWGNIRKLKQGENALEAIATIC